MNGQTDGSQLLGSMTADLGTVMALFIAIVLSGLFAGEWHDNTKPLLLTTRNGWQKIGMAKVCTGFCFAIELFTLLATGTVLSQLFLWVQPVMICPYRILRC